MKSNKILPYLGGVMDSDGCFTMKRSSNRMRLHDCINPQYIIRALLKQTSPIVVDILHKKFNGARFISKPSAKNGKPLHCWEVSGRSAEKAIKALLPYLKIKRKQAEILIQLRNLKKKGRKGHNVSKIKGRWGVHTARRSCYSDMQIFEFNELYLRIRELNDTRFDPNHWSDGIVQLEPPGPRMEIQ